MSDDTAVLKAKIRKLERELLEREQDISFFKNELNEVNTRLESLIERMQSELKAANKIQKILVPTEFPSVPGFEFSTKFVPSHLSGSDYFDIFDSAEKMRFGIILASSSGYSMSALLMSVFLKYSATRWVRQDNTVAVVIDEIVKELQKDMAEQDRASLFFGLIDRRSYELEFAIMGPICGFHYIDADKELVPLVEEAQPELSSNFQPQILFPKVNLQSRDRLILCSPGFLKVKNLADKEYTVDQVRDSILKVVKKPVHEIRNEILFQAEKFAEGTQSLKDRTVVVVEVKDRVIKLAK